MVARIARIFHIERAPDDNEYWQTLTDDTKLLMRQSIVEFTNGNLDADFIEMLHLLTEFHVNYLIIGGMAVVHHGYKREVGDLDIWIDHDHLPLFAKCLQEFRFAPGDTARLITDLRATDSVLQIGNPPHRVDVICRMTGADFRSAFNRRVAIDIGGRSFDIISVEDLIRIKMLTSRKKDAEDIHALMKIKVLRNE